MTMTLDTGRNAGGRHSEPAFAVRWCATPTHLAKHCGRQGPAGQSEGCARHLPWDVNRLALRKRDELAAERPERASRSMQDTAEDNRVQPVMYQELITSSVLSGL